MRDSIDEELARSHSALREQLAITMRDRDAVTTERDTLRAKVVAYGQAHDARTAHSKRADSGAELWFAERDELNNAVSDALAALREAAK